VKLVTAVRIKREATETESRVEDTFTFLKPHRQNRYRAAAEPLYDSDGEVDGAMFAAIDISDRYQLLERATDAVYTVDSDWTITFWNQQMAERTGRPASDVVGETLWDVFGDTVPPKLEQRYRTVMETRESAEFEQYLPAPYEYWVEVRVFADKDGLSIYSRDITDRKEREQELRRNREFLKQTQEVAQVGGWEVDFETGSVEWTDEVYRIHGLSPDQSGFDIDEAIAFYHPEDRETIREALDSVRTDGESYDLELRIISIAGTDVLFTLKAGGVGFDAGVLDGALTEHCDAFGEVIVGECPVGELVAGAGNRGLVREDPGVERPADSPEVVERRRRKAPARNAEQADRRLLELVEPAVIEGVFECPGVRAVVHRRPEQDSLGMGDRVPEAVGVTRVLRVRVEHRQVVGTQVDERRRRAACLCAVECVYERSARVTVVSEAATECRHVWCGHGRH
jgi:PAS domain S-box-containing protein